MDRAIGVAVRETAPAAKRTRAQAARRRLLALAPTLVLAVLLLLIARAEYYKHGYNSLLGFATVGWTYGARIGVPGGVSRDGYDGQFAYYLALRPDLIGACAHPIARCPLDNLREVRVERILYPLTARALALGQPALIPFALVLVNFLAILLTSFLIGQMCVELGASRWLGLAAGLFSGETLALVHDLTDPFAVFWLVLAVYLLRKERWLLSAIALAAALLTREQLLFTVPLLALALVGRQRWGTLAAWSAIALAPFLAWQTVLRILYGSWPLLAGDTHAAGILPVPFLGFWQARTFGDFKVEAVTVALPVGIALALAALAIRRNGLSALPRDPLPAVVLVYCLILSMVASIQWADLNGPGRLAAPGVLLAMVVAAGQARLARISYALVLGVPSVVALLGDLNYLLGAHPHF